MHPCPDGCVHRARAPWLPIKNPLAVGGHTTTAKDARATNTERLHRQVRHLYQTCTIVDKNPALKMEGGYHLPITIDINTMPLQQLHPDARSRRIFFEETQHKYYIDGHTDYWVSTTGLLGCYFPEFNDITKSQEMAMAVVSFFGSKVQTRDRTYDKCVAQGKSPELCSEYRKAVGYLRLAQHPELLQLLETHDEEFKQLCTTLGGIDAVMDCVTPDEFIQTVDMAIQRLQSAPLLELQNAFAVWLRDHWKKQNAAAAPLGTHLHLTAEHRINGLEDPPLPPEIPGGNRPEAAYVSRFLAMLWKSGYVPYVTEGRWFDTELLLAGSGDFLAFHLKTGTWVLFDWKRTVDYAKRAFGGEKCTGVLQCLENNKCNHWFIQLNIYAAKLRRRCGISVALMAVVVFHPDNGRFVVVVIPPCPDLVEKIFAERLVKVKQLRQKHPNIPRQTDQTLGPSAAYHPPQPGDEPIAPMYWRQLQTKARSATGLSPDEAPTAAFLQSLPVATPCPDRKMLGLDGEETPWPPKLAALAPDVIPVPETANLLRHQCMAFGTKRMRWRLTEQDGPQKLWPRAGWRGAAVAGDHTRQSALPASWYPPASWDVPLLTECKFPMMHTTTNPHYPIVKVSCTCAFKPFVILVSGSRNWVCQQRIWDALEAVLCAQPSRPFYVRLLHGACRGADAMCASYAKLQGWEVIAFPADWTKYKKAAGPRRNRIMMQQQPDHVVVFPLPESKGTKNVITLATKALIPLTIVPFV